MCRWFLLSALRDTIAMDIFVTPQVGAKLALGERVQLAFSRGLRQSQHPPATSDPGPQRLRGGSHVGPTGTVRRNAFELPSFQNPHPLYKALTL